MRTTTMRLVGLIAAATLVAAACTDDATTKQSTQDTAANATVAPDGADSTMAQDETMSTTGASQTDGSGDGTDRANGSGDGIGLTVDQLDPSVQTLVTNLALGYRQVDGVWDGFVPNEHPAVVVFKNQSDTIPAALAVNHPDPQAMGTATAVDVAGLPFTSLHQITEPSEKEKLDNLQGFDFHAVLGGVDSFAMEAGGDDFFDPTSKDYVSTLLHEMFHRYQDEAFGPIQSQDVEGYAYTAENLELAVLEERALDQAIAAQDDATRRMAAERFAAIRLVRQQADERVKLDHSQERFEGTARYIEHALGSDGADSGYVYHRDNYGRDLITGFDAAGGAVKDTFGFGRWYASGAAAMHLLNLLEVDGVVARVEAGEGPTEILVAELQLTSDTAEKLVGEAKAEYDPLGRLAADATEAAEAAKGEGPVFGDDDGFGSDAGDEEGIYLSDEEIECLVEQGVDMDGDDTITDEQWDACIAA